jgi:primosomal replication protein N
VNQLQLTASVIERDVLRYTPAGIPVVNAVIAHESEQIEAGIKRLVGLEMTALAAGKVAERFNQTALGTVFRFTGFIARKNRNSKSLVFHIIDFDVYS